MQTVLLSGLLKLELPGRDLLLCDGGFVRWGDDLYVSRDDEFGLLAGFDALTEGVGDEAPAGSLTLAPPSTAAAATLSQPGYQGARLRMWIAEIDPATGLIVGTPDAMVDWQLDQTRLRIGRGTRQLEMGCVTRAQRLMLRNEGNVLSTTFHAGIYKNEAGLNNATGLTIDVAWGVAAAPRGTAAA